MSTILLVDDNPTDRTIFRRLLAAGGHTVHELARGAEVIREVGEIRPHVVVLDVNLPDTDGHALCRALKADPVASGIPVLMLTVQDRRDDIVAGLAAGADDYVAKDEAVPVILARVNRLAEYRKLVSMAMINEQLAQVGRLLAGIVHEIRAPLSVIRGHAELMLAMMPDNAQVQEFTEPIVRGALALQSRLEHLMAAVRTGPSEARQVDVADVLREASDLFSKGTDPRTGRVSVTVEVEPGLPVALVDPGRLHQVILNLLANAHEAIGGRGGLGRIDVRAASAPRDGSEWVRVDVLDDGPGVPDQILSRLFEPFFTTKDEGSGYGLYLAHQIIQGQGGYLEASNVDGGGAQFTVWLRASTETALMAGGT